MLLLLVLAKGAGAVAGEVSPNILPATCSILKILWDLFMMYPTLRFPVEAVAAVTAPKAAELSRLLLS